MPLTRLLSILLTLAAAGCRPAAPPPPVNSGPAVAEPTWSEQLADIRAGRAQQIIVTSVPTTAAQIAELADGCAALEVLSLHSIDPDSQTVAIIAGLPNLKNLGLGGPIDDEALATLASATNLISLNLPNATFTDRGLEHLAKLPQLELLRCHSPNVTDEGLRHIAALPALRFLHLIDVPVTDAGITQLHPMSRLESFYLDGGHCTDEGLHALLKALPNLHFHRDQLHLANDPLADDHSPARPVQSRRPK